MFEVGCRQQTVGMPMFVLGGESDSRIEALQAAGRCVWENLRCRWVLSLRTGPCASHSAVILVDGVGQMVMSLSLLAL